MERAARAAGERARPPWRAVRRQGLGKPDDLFLLKGLGCVDLGWGEGGGGGTLCR